MGYMKVIVLAIVVFATAAWIQEAGNMDKMMACVNSVPTAYIEATEGDLTDCTREAVLTKNYLDAYEKGVR